MTVAERNAKKSQAYSRWHRKQKPWLKMTDIDCLEYRTKRGPVALVETKHDREDLVEANARAMSQLADLAGLPFFCVWHSASQSDYDAINEDGDSDEAKAAYSRMLFDVQAVNAKAKEMLPTHQVMSSKEYADWLERL